jgi:hypothetical protein
MKLSVQIAAAKRRLRRMQEDRPHFLQRISSYADKEKAPAIAFFDKTLKEAEAELHLLTRKSKLHSS